MNIFRRLLGGNKYDRETSESLQNLYDEGYIIAANPPKAHGEDGKLWLARTSEALDSLLPTEQFTFDSEPDGVDKSVICLRQIIMRYEQRRT